MQSPRNCFLSTKVLFFEILATFCYQPLCFMHPWNYVCSLLITFFPRQMLSTFLRNCGFSVVTENFFPLLFFLHRVASPRNAFLFLLQRGNLYVCGIVQQSAVSFCMHFWSVRSKKNFPFNAIVLCLSSGIAKVSFLCHSNFSLFFFEKTEKLSPCRWRIRSTVCCMQEFSWLFFVLQVMLQSLCMQDYAC